MTTPEDIIGLLKKMEYTDEFPSEENLKNLCRGTVGTLFQQLIENVSSANEVRNVRLNILINRIKNENTTQSLNARVNGDWSNDVLSAYKTKQQLQSKLQDIIKMNEQSNKNIEFMMRKVKNKQVKLQVCKQRIKENERQIYLYNAKCEHLGKQIKKSEEILTKINDHRLVEKEQDTNNVVMENIEKVVSSISQTIEKRLSERPIDPVANKKSFLELPTMTTNRESWKRLMSRQPLSTCKKLLKKPSLEFNESIVLPSAIKRRTSMISFNTTIPNERSMTDKCSELMNDIDEALRSDEKLKEDVTRLWRSTGRTEMYKMLVELKRRDKERIAEMTRPHDDIGDSRGDVKRILGNLYMHHIQEELARHKSLLEQKRLMHHINVKLDQNNDQLRELKSIEAGLQMSVAYLRNLEFQCEDVGVTELEATLSETREIQKTAAIKRQRAGECLRALHESNLWLDKSQAGVNLYFPRGRTMELGADFRERYSVIFRDVVQNSVSEIFTDSWSKIYDMPEILDLIGQPFLCPEAIVMRILTHKNFLRKLKAITDSKATCVDKNWLAEFLEMECKEPDFTAAHDTLRNAQILCRGTLPKFDRFQEQINAWLESPMLSCMSTDRLFNGKNFQHYLQMYDEFYTQLARR